MTADNDNPLPLNPPSTEGLLESSATPGIAASLPPEFSQELNGFSRPARKSLPEDLRVPWDWIDLLLLVLISFCAIFCLSFLVAMSIGLFRAHAVPAQRPVAMRGFFSVVVQVALDLFLLVYLAAQMRVRFRSPFWRTIGWRPLEMDGASKTLIYGSLVFAGIFLQALVTAVSSTRIPKQHLPIQTVLEDPHAAILFMLVAVLVAPVVEETVFRGYIYPVVARTFGVTASVIATGVLFGLLHAPQLWGGWLQIGLLVTVGIVFTFARAVSKTVVTSYILHTSYNSVQVVTWLVGTYGLRHLPVGR